MTRVVYVNGRYLPYAKAAVHVEDRGFQFGDAVYEVCEVRDGHLVDEPRHMARLARSLAALKIDAPMSAAALAHVMRETIRRNRVRRGLVYLQVTRGEGPREFTFPAADVARTVVCLARPLTAVSQEAAAETGIWRMIHKSRRLRLQPVVFRESVKAGCGPKPERPELIGQRRYGYSPRGRPKPRRRWRKRVRSIEKRERFHSRSSKDSEPARRPENRYRALDTRLTRPSPWRTSG